MALFVFIGLFAIYILFKGNDVMHKSEVISVRNVFSKQDKRITTKTKYEASPDNIKLFKIIEMVERGSKEEYKVPKESLAIRKDIAKLSPCDFLKKYQNYENQEALWFAMVNDYGQDTGQSLLYVREQGYDKIDGSLEVISENLALELINVEFLDYVKLPTEMGIKENSETYFKSHSVVETKLTSLIDNIYSKIDESLFELDSSINPVYAALMVYNLKTDYKYENYEIPNDDWENPKEEYILVKSENIKRIKNKALREKTKGMLQEMFINYAEGKPVNLIPHKMRMKYLTLAKNPTEMALALNMFKRTKRVDYKNLFKLGSDLKKWNVKYYQRFRKYLKNYVDYIINNEDATYVNEELYKVLSLYDNRLQNISYREFIYGKKTILDPIYGEGCDDRRYKDLCTKYCLSNQ